MRGVVRMKIELRAPSNVRSATLLDYWAMASRPSSRRAFLPVLVGGLAPAPRAVVQSTGSQCAALRRHTSLFYTWLSSSRPQWGSVVLEIVWDLIWQLQFFRPRPSGGPGSKVGRVVLAAGGLTRPMTQRTCVGRELGLRYLVRFGISLDLTSVSEAFRDAAVRRLLGMGDTTILGVMSHLALCSSTGTLDAAPTRTEAETSVGAATSPSIKEEHLMLWRLMGAASRRVAKVEKHELAREVDTIEDLTN